MRSEYDNNKLKAARRLVNDTLEYYYGTKYAARLETIVNKLDYLIAAEQEEKKGK